MDKLKYIKLENADGSYSDSIPLSVSANHVDIDSAGGSTNLANYISENDTDISNLKNTTLTLESQVSSLASGSPLVASSIAEMIDKTHIYVNTTDGYWYYWNSNAWSSGGIYQAAEDSNTLEKLNYNINNVFNFESDNLFDQNNVIVNKQINNQGDLDSYGANGLSTSEQIYINPEISYTFNPLTTSKVLIKNNSGIKHVINLKYMSEAPEWITKNSDNSFIVTLPQNYTNCFIQFTVNTSDLDNTYLIEGTERITENTLKNTKIPYLDDDIEKIKDNLNINGNIYCWGDSLTAGTGSNSGGGVPYPTSLQTVLKGQFNVYNRGVGGESSLTILGRQGSMPYITTPPTTINGSTTTGLRIDFTSDGGEDVAPCRQGNVGVNPVTISGIKGNLAYSSSQQYYYFVRSKNGEQVTIDRPTPIITIGHDEKSDILIMFIGQNGGWDDDPQVLVQQYKKAINFNGSSRYLLLGLTSNTKQYRESLENAMYNEFGRHYINLREYMSKYGLSDYNITPTAEDISQMEVGAVPSSLRYDGVHGNAYYYDIITRLIFERGKELGYWIDTEESEEALSNVIIPASE